MNSTIEPFSRLSLMLAIQRAHQAGFAHFAHALKTIYLQMYREK